LNSGYSLFNNKLGGVYNVANLALNQGGIVTNDGILSAGGIDNLHQAHISGTFVQSDSGVLLFDASATQADEIIVAGNVELDGGLRIKFSEIGAPRSINILSSYWLDTRNLTLMNVAMDATITYVDDTDVVLDFVGVKYGADILSRATRPVGDSLTAAYNAGTPALEDFFLHMIHIVDDAQYQYAFDQLTPKLIETQEHQAQLSAVGFADSLMSCPADAGQVFGIGQGSCVWSRGERVTIDQETFGTLSAYNASDMNQQVGGQLALNSNVYLGLSMGSNNSELDGGAMGDSTQSGAQFGLALKYVEGPWLLAAAFSGSNANVETTRHVVFDEYDETLTSMRNISSQNLRLRAANSFDLSTNAYLKSVLDLNVTNLSTDTATETGGIFALKYAAGDDLIYSIAPSVELGAKISAGTDLTINPFIRVGEYLQTGNSQDLTVDFALSEAEDGNATIENSVGTSRKTWAVGLNVIKGNAGSLNLMFNRQIGDGADISAVSLKGTLRF